MVEDIEFNLMLKAALEEGGAFKTPREIKRRSFRSVFYFAPVLLAASLVVVASFHLGLTREFDRVGESIALLSAVDEFDVASEGASDEELLLAWQEAPYASELEEYEEAIAL